MFRFDLLRCSSSWFFSTRVKFWTTGPKFTTSGIIGTSGLRTLSRFCAASLTTADGVVGFEIEPNLLFV